MRNKYYPEDEEIWTDFKYWIENPITKEEQDEREKELDNYINALIKKAFED